MDQGASGKRRHTESFMSFAAHAKPDLMYLAMDTKETDEPKRRSYEMRARREATQATHEAIVQAAVDSVIAERSLAITLNTIADRAGVSVKTLLRHFGTREPLIAAAWARIHQDVIVERTTPPEDADEALRVLLEHYEHRGDMMLGLLSEEGDDPRARIMCDTGRMEHRRWVQEVFAGRLPKQPAARSRVVDALVVATDLYSWKLLRRDRDLGIEDVFDRIQLMTDGVLRTAAQDAAETPRP